LLIGETGIGKTLLAMELAAAIAAGADVLGWQGQAPARVIYLDGELTAETFKDRMQLIAERYGSDIKLFGYSRDVLGPDDMPPLNTPEGQKWLWREIDAIKPHMIFFDAIMSLLGGSMSEEESWAPVKGFCRQISNRRIAQVWLHHTGHDGSRGFGTKTREWEMDAVIMLTRLKDENGRPDEEPGAAFKLEFTKSRMSTPRNYKQFAPRIVRCLAQGFVTDTSPVKSETDIRRPNEAVTIRRAFEQTYERLADGILKVPGLDGKPVIKVQVEVIKADLRSRGYLDIDDRGNVTATARTRLHRAKLDLIATGRFMEKEGLFWRV
jgi:hypothetical protein